MKYDNLNFHIISSILSSKKISSWTIAKNYGWEDKPQIFKNKKESDNFYTKKTNLIERRLETMKIDEEGKKGFVLKDNGVWKVIIELVHKRTLILPDKTRAELIFIKDDYGCWEFFNKFQ